MHTWVRRGMCSVKRSAWGAKALVLRQLVCTIETSFPVTHAGEHILILFKESHVCILGNSSYVLVINHDRESNTPGLQTAQPFFPFIWGLARDVASRKIMYE